MRVALRERSPRQAAERREFQVAVSRTEGKKADKPIDDERMMAMLAQKMGGRASTMIRPSCSS